MGRFILIQDDDYERQYWESINYLNHKYHDQPTRLKDIPEADQGIGTHGASRFRVPTHRSTPLGKLVI